MSQQNHAGNRSSACLTGLWPTESCYLKNLMIPSALDIAQKQYEHSHNSAISQSSIDSCYLLRQPSDLTQGHFLLVRLDLKGRMRKQCLSGLMNFMQLEESNNQHMQYPTFLCMLDIQYVKESLDILTSNIGSC